MLKTSILNHPQPLNATKRKLFKCNCKFTLMYTKYNVLFQIKEKSYQNLFFLLENLCNFV